MSCTCKPAPSIVPPPQSASCSCCASSPPASEDAPNTISTVRLAAMGMVAIALWTAAWFAILPLSRFLAHGLLGLPEASPLGQAVQFFLYDTPKILLLLALMIYVMAWLRAGLQTDRLRDYLASRGRGLGYALAAAFGAISPFCSCSSVPLFIGFATARIPIGISMAFLITSPIINEVAVVLLWGLLGWQFTLMYITVGMAAGIVGGLLMDALRAERWLQPFLQKSAPVPAQPMPGCTPVPPTMAERHAFAKAETANIFHRVWLWVLMGVALGAGLHGFVPENWFAEHLGSGQWWSVPVAVVSGIPLYANCSGIVPVMAGLLSAGLPAGTTLAFCMSAVATSLPELVMLRQVMQLRLLAIFLAFLWLIFTLSGWLFNFVF